jgi:dethiobiotin synthetase
MQTGYFVTGTDTGVGKTEVSLGLMHALQVQGFTVVAMKPISAGCEQTAQGLRNADALRLQAQASTTLPYEVVNPYAFRQPVAPHIAAAAAGVEMQTGHLHEGFLAIAGQAERVVVEGVGGWLVPINRHQTAADMARTIGLPVILVVGMRLGCLNHALLTDAAIRATGLTCAGWVANLVDPDMLFVDENIDDLRQRIAAPLLGVIPHLARPLEPAAVARHLNLGLL